MSSKVSALTALAGANVATDDNLYIVDTSAGASKRITWEEFLLGSRANATFTGVTKFAAGTELAPSVAWGDGTYGWYSFASGSVGYATSGYVAAIFQPTVLALISGYGIAWNGDTGITRASAGMAEINNGTAGAYRDLRVRDLTAALGGSTGSGKALNTANVNTTAVGNVDAGEDDLMTYALPASALSAAGKGVHIIVWGTTANNGNAKTLKLYFGTAVILTNALTVSIAGVWRIEADVFSTGTDTQDAIAQLVTTGTAGAAANDVEFTTPTQDDGAAITIKCTGEGVATNDIVQQGLRVTMIN